MKKMDEACRLAMAELKSMGLDELSYLADKNKESTTAAFLKTLQQDSCHHNFIRDPDNFDFECVYCGFKTDGKKMKEWRD